MFVVKKRNYTQKFKQCLKTTGLILSVFPEAFESLNIVDTNYKGRNITEAFIALG